jgi:hypothetical protein
MVQLFKERLRSLSISQLVALIIGAVAMTAANAQTITVYNSIPKSLPGNVASEGPEAYAFAELGDGLGLATTAGGTLNQVTVILSSWACQSGNWSAGNCVTASAATFSQLITLNVYMVTGSTPGAQIGTIVQAFNIPYRPTSTPALCGGDNQRWYDNKDKTCYHGIAVPIEFSGLHIPIPANNQIIVTLAYNTTDYGPNPIGRTACNSTNAGCPYDSLNIGTDGNGSSGLTGGVGGVLFYDGIFVNYTLSATACSGNSVTGVLALDSPCWTGFHPQIQVLANANSKPHTKGNAP